MTGSVNYRQLPDGITPKNTDVYSAVDVTDTNQSPDGTTKRYTIQALSSFVNLTAPVKSVAGKTGDVTLVANDITNFNTAAAAAAPVQSVNGLTGSVTLTTANINDTVNKRYLTDAQLQTVQNTSGINTGDQNLFKNITATGQSTITASTTTANLNFAAGPGGSVALNPSTNTVTYSFTGGSGVSSAFSAGLNGPFPNATGNGTIFQVNSYNATINTGTALNLSSGVFTAPSTNSYSFSVTAHIYNIDGSHNDLSVYLITSEDGTTFYPLTVVSPQNCRSYATGALILSGSIVLYLSSGITVYLAIAVSGGSQVITVGEQTKFSCLWV